MATLRQKIRVLMTDTAVGADLIYNPEGFDPFIDQQVERLYALLEALPKVDLNPPHNPDLPPWYAVHIPLNLYCALPGGEYHLIRLEED